MSRTGFANHSTISLSLWPTQAVLHAQVVQHSPVDLSDLLSSRQYRSGSLCALMAAACMLHLPPHTMVGVLENTMSIRRTATVQLTEETLQEKEQKISRLRPVKAKAPRKTVFHSQLKLETCSSTPNGTLNPKTINLPETLNPPKP